MITYGERIAKIKEQIAKAVSEIEHGDVSSAVLALADGLSAIVQWEEVLAKAAGDYEKELKAYYERRLAEQMPMPIVVGPGEGDHPRVSEVKEAPARIKVTKR